MSEAETDETDETDDSKEERESPPEERQRGIDLAVRLGLGLGIALFFTSRGQSDLALAAFPASVLVPELARTGLKGIARIGNGVKDGLSLSADVAAIAIQSVANTPASIEQRVVRPMRAASLAVLEKLRIDIEAKIHDALEKLRAQIVVIVRMSVPAVEAQMSSLEGNLAQTEQRVTQAEADYDELDTEGTAYVNQLQLEADQRKREADQRIRELEDFILEQDLSIETCTALLEEKGVSRETIARAVEERRNVQIREQMVARLRSFRLEQRKRPQDN